MVNHAPAPSGSSLTTGSAPQFTGATPHAEPLDVTEDRQLATLAHLGGVAGALPSYLIHRIFADRGPFTRQESREALNFSLLPTLIIVGCTVLAMIPFIGWIFALTAAGTWVFLAAQSVIAGIKVNQGEPYQYRGNTMLFDKIQQKRASHA